MHSCLKFAAILLFISVVSSRSIKSYYNDDNDNSDSQLDFELRELERSLLLDRLRSSINDQYYRRAQLDSESEEYVRKKRQLPYDDDDEFSNEDATESREDNEDDDQNNGDTYSPIFDNDDDESNDIDESFNNNQNDDSNQGNYFFPQILRL